MAFSWKDDIAKNQLKLKRRKRTLDKTGNQDEVKRLSRRIK